MLKPKSIIYVFCLIGVVLSPSAKAQVNLPATEAAIQQVVSELRSATTNVDRAKHSEALMVSLKRVFVDKQAYDHPFKTLELAQVQPPDGKFRLITWNIPQEDGTHQFHGLMVLEQRGRITKVELVDIATELENPEQIQLPPKRWYGALYYDVIMSKRGGKVYYTLLGWKAKSRTVTEKVIDVLNLRGTRVTFGAPLFMDEQEKVLSRRVFGFAYDATMTLRKDVVENEQSIIFDHLSPSRADMAGQPAFYGPDMSFDAYRWRNGKWLLERDIDARDKSKDKRPYHAPPKEVKPK